MSDYKHEDRDDAFNEAVAITLSPGQRGTVTFEPEGRVSDYYLPTLAVSKHPNSTYKVETDGTTEYGPAPVPPTDVDDDSDTFRPPETFADEAVIVIENLDSSTTRTYFVQAVGWERRRFPGEGGW